MTEKNGVISNYALNRVGIEMLKDSAFSGVVSKNASIAKEDSLFCNLLFELMIKRSEIVSDNNYGDLEKLPA